MSYDKLNILLNYYFSKSHGVIKLNSYFHNFILSPHISKNNSKDYILLGDTLRSIHPVAGQGWNLGVKDIQALSTVLDMYSLEDKNFNKLYHSKRNIENLSYLTFTSALNFLYENKFKINSLIIKFGFQTLIKFSTLRNLFIKQAMGRLKLI